MSLIQAWICSLSSGTRKGKKKPTENRIIKLLVNSIIRKSLVTNSHFSFIYHNDFQSTSSESKGVGVFPPRKREKGKAEGMNFSVQAEMKALLPLLRPQHCPRAVQTCPQVPAPSPRAGPAAPVPGSSMFSVSVWRLKGSVEELRRCLRMMDLSMMVPEGSRTGSVIRVSIRGSAHHREKQLQIYLPTQHSAQPYPGCPQYTAELTEKG